MRLSFCVSTKDLRPSKVIPRGAVARLLLLPCLTLFSVSSLMAQQAVEGTVADQQTLQLLLKRIDQLEARVAQLEAEKRPSTAASSFQASSPAPVPANPPVTLPSILASAKPTDQKPGPAQTAPSPASESDQLQSENAMAERMDLSKTLLRIRGFGDVSLHGDNQKGDTTSFSLGELDLFTTSDISEKFKFLSEIVFEGGPSSIYGVPRSQPGQNNFEVDLERYLIQYSYNDYLNISAGRLHTAIGYYNTAYHHSTWLQTTTGRPFLFEFEDEGGILPIHMVGVSASGQIPSGSLGLHYVAEMGNGRASRTPLTEEPVQNVTDENNHKAFNLAVFARPDAVPGLQAGFSVYRDVLAPLNSARVSETILAAHAIYIRANYEWLNEAMVIRHALIGEAGVYNTPGFYSQVSRQFGSFRPYFRYQYVNAANNEPIFPDVALRDGPSAGVRFDASEFVALKLQYDYTFLRQQTGVNSLALQLGFTF
jgi:hypothetical protein